MSSFRFKPIIRYDRGGGILMMQFLTTESFVLASASPRRKELFGNLHVPFQVVTSDVDETTVTVTSPAQYVRDVALLKAQDVKRKCPEAVVIGADTVVVYEDKLLHKPKTKQQAIQHLQMLSNDTHTVMTAVAILMPNGEIDTFTEQTKVIFKNIPQALLEAYVDSGDPFDKAGGYGIQTEGVFFVDRIEGDYNNVVGLPLATLAERLLSHKLITI